MIRSRSKPAVSLTRPDARWITGGLPPSATRKRDSMQTYWLKFTDGSTGYCQGQSKHDVVTIAEKITGKTVEPGPNKWRKDEWESIKTNPYAVRNMIWAFEHPVYGKEPAFCNGGPQCIGRGACPRNFACTE